MLVVGRVEAKWVGERGCTGQRVLIINDGAGGGSLCLLLLASEQGPKSFPLAWGS